MQPIPAMSNGPEGFRNSHPMLLVVACDEAIDSIPAERWRDGFIEPQTGNILNPPSTVRFYSLRSHNYVHSLRFRSTVYMIRSSPQILAVGLVAQVSIFIFHSRLVGVLYTIEYSSVLTCMLAF